ncbi:MAG: TIGR01777 family oxidoreductase [Blastocatellia bacterium]
MKVLITGATGLIGRGLCHSLTGEGHEVIALSRSPQRAKDIAVAEAHRWEPEAGPPPDEALNGVDAVVHLAGEPIAARRWSDEQKRRIRDSRVASTRNLVNALRLMAIKPRVLVSSSAVGFYGDRGDELLNESSAAGAGFMSEVCESWEREAERARLFGVRVVEVRTGVVLSAEGGALKKMLPPIKLGVGGPLGGGKQWFPWIHIEDIVGIFRHAIKSSSLSGPVNGTAPGLVNNAELTKQLGRVLHRPTFLGVPEFALRGLMGEMADVLLGSQRVIPKAVLDDGYKFQYPSLPLALEDLLGDKGKRARAAAN